MNDWAGWVLLAVPGLIVLRGVIAKIDVYGAFVEGAKEGLRSAVGLVPALTAMTLMLGLMSASGLNAWLTRLLAPLLRGMNLPEEVSTLLVLRPLTGSGSLKALEQVFAQCGVDSRAGRIAAVLMGASETVFYTMTVYLGATRVRKLPWVVPVSLASYAVGAAVAGAIM